MTKILSGYILYYFPSCSFCRIVVDEIESLQLKIEMRNIQKNSKFRAELVTGGGKSTVPCLKHPNGRWQYESADIIDFFYQNFT